jgi:hypothetical protein
VTSNDTSLRKTPQRIDELTRGDHPHLLVDDVVLYFGDYSPGAGGRHSRANDLIYDFKMPMSKQGDRLWRFKAQKISQAARLVSGYLGPWLNQLTLVPVPPSKSSSHPLHDNRVLSMLRQVQAPNGQSVDVRELIIQVGDRAAAHEGTAPRPTVAELQGIYQIDLSITGNLRSQIVIVDDVLTKGTSFRAMKTILAAQFPATPIVGLFLARTVRERPDFQMIFSDK